VLLLDGVASAASADQVREQVERVLRDPVELGTGKDDVELVGTVGMALYPGDAHEPDELLRAADEDMIRRKPASVSQW
jgi:GGDEF domain-containing protein